MAVDTSNWVNGTSDAGFTFQMPPYWASDPVDKITEAIRTDKSDAVLLISNEPINFTESKGFQENVTDHLQKKMADLKVPHLEIIEHEANNVTASGTTLYGTIITAREEFGDNHIKRWICEYSNADAVTKYTNTMLAIINSTEFR
nr:hypothetical protein [uncultured Methanospirillum sp.]